MLETAKELQYCAEASMNAGLWALLWIGRVAVAVGALTTEVRAQEPINPIGLQRTDFTVAGAPSR